MNLSSSYRLSLGNPSHKAHIYMHVSWLQVSFKSTILKNILPYLNVKYIHKTISRGMSPDGDFQGNWTSTCHAALKDKTPG